MREVWKRGKRICFYTQKTNYQNIEKEWNWKIIFYIQLLYQNVIINTYICSIIIDRYYVLFYWCIGMIYSIISQNKRLVEDVSLLQCIGNSLYLLFEIFSLDLICEFITEREVNFIKLPQLCRTETWLTQQRHDEHWKKNRVILT